MVNLLTAEQTREADRVTIVNRHLSSENLMEEAAKAFVARFTSAYPDRSARIGIYCGTGNNGGDGLAIGRLLKKEGYLFVTARIARFSGKSSPDFKTNLSRAGHVNLEVTGVESDLPAAAGDDLLIDALLGSGLNRPLEGEWETLVKKINTLGKNVIAVDVPTGFKTEGPVTRNSTVLKCSSAFTFQLPKINFFFPEAAEAMDRFEVIDIGLDQEFIRSQPGYFKLVSESAIKQILKPRNEFSHKGTYGHTLIIAGQQGTMGAAILCSGASVYAGSGLTTAFIPSEGMTAMNTVFPEVMTVSRGNSDGKRPVLPAKMERFTAAVAGPGLGTDVDTKTMLSALFSAPPPGIVLDADALNLLAADPDLARRLPPGSVITPHMKEFDRLFGDHDNWWSRVQTAREQASARKIVIVLKSRYTFIITPQEQVYINPTGTPAMASGGAGDVLAGTIGALLSQGCPADKAAILGVFVHGQAGEQDDQYVVTPSGLIRALPYVMKRLAGG